MQGWLPPAVHHRQAPQGCTTGVPHRRAPQACTTGVHHRGAPQGCPTDVHHRSAPQGCTTGVHHRGAPQECTTGVHHRGDPQTCTTGVHHRSAPQGCTTGVHHKKYSIQVQLTLDSNVLLKVGWLPWENRPGGSALTYRERRNWRFQNKWWWWWWTHDSTEWKSNNFQFVKLALTNWGRLGIWSIPGCPSSAL